MATTFSDNFERSDGPLTDNGWSGGPNKSALEIEGGDVTNPDSGTTERVAANTSTGVTIGQGWWAEMVLGDIPSGNQAVEVLGGGEVEGGGWSARITSNGFESCVRVGDEFGRFEGPVQAIVPQTGDVIRMAYNEPGEGSAINNLRYFYNGAIQNSLTITNDDPDVPIGDHMGMWIEADSGAGSIQSVTYGNWLGGTSISNVNGSNSADSNGQFFINGAELDGTTAVRVTDGVNPHVLAFTASEARITVTPWDIHDTLLVAGTLTLEVDHPEGNMTHDYIQNIDPDNQLVTLASVDTNFMAKDITGVADGWLLEVPLTVAGSSITLEADSDTIYSPAVPQGTTHTRWAYDNVTPLWDSGTVTINQAAVAPPDAPQWIGNPNPITALADQAYEYVLADLITGERPITLSDAGNALPTGLAYNSTYPESIVGTAPGVIGSSITTGIVILATNANGSDESAPCSITVKGYPVLTEQAVSGITENSAEIRVRTDQAGGFLHWVAHQGTQPAPTGPQIEAGTLYDDTAASSSGVSPVGATGGQGPFLIAPFLAASTNSYYFVQKSVDGVNYSNVVGGTFVTLNKGGTPVDPTDPADGADPQTLVSFFTSNSGVLPNDQPIESQDSETPESSPPEDGPGASSTKW